MSDNNPNNLPTQPPPGMGPSFLRTDTVATKIWNSISSQPISLFALPAQPVSHYCEPITIEPTKLYLKYKIGSLINALEEAFGKRYDFQVVDKYIAVSEKE